MRPEKVSRRAKIFTTKIKNLHQHRGWKGFLVPSKTDNVKLEHFQHNRTRVLRAAH